MFSFIKLTTRLNSTFSKIKSLHLLNNKRIENVKVQGWIRNLRKMKNYCFIDINDGSIKNLQIIIQQVKLDTMDTIGIGCSVEASGKLVKSESGPIELHADNFSIIGYCDFANGYPFTPKQSHPPEYTREYLHLRSRIDYMSSIFRIRHRASKIIHDFMDENDFVQIHTPILTSNDCEGAGETFVAKPNSENLLKTMTRPQVPLNESYFDKKVFLTVSSQLHLEAMSYGLGNTYSFSPAFRAENSKSPLHLSEFYMLEAELIYISDLENLAEFIEVMIKSITDRILEKCSDDLNVLKSNNTLGRNSINIDWLQKKWIRLEYSDAYETLKQHEKSFGSKLNNFEGFSKEQESFLVKHFGCPVFIVDWPINMKPFYMKTKRNDNSKVEALDLLMPEVGEIIGGSLREHDVERLNNLVPQGLNWYLELRKFGNIPTGGFGMGFERYLQLITGIKNIRDVISFPRYPHNCKM